MRKKSGYSLIEVLVVLTIFALLAIVTSQGILLTLRGTRKSESVITVRENVSFALSIIERHLHNALDVVPCPNLDPLVLDYTDADGNPGSFSCVDVGETGYVASSSARITETDVAILSCSFACATGTGASPPSVIITLTAEDNGAEGIESAQFNTSTQIYLRNF